jgi:hypothetical protein
MWKGRRALLISFCDEQHNTDLTIVAVEFEAAYVTGKLSAQCLLREFIGKIRENRGAAHKFLAKITEHGMF